MDSNLSFRDLRDRPLESFKERGRDTPDCAWASQFHATLFRTVDCRYKYCSIRTGSLIVALLVVMCKPLGIYNLINELKL